jgi:hypothetical protein
MRYNNNVWAIAYHYADIDSKVYEGFFGIYYFNIFIASECEGDRWLNSNVVIVVLLLNVI